MSSRRVLVVDDEPAMQRVLEIMLRRMGHEVLLAADGQTPRARADAVDHAD
jgi:two-component system response regulator AtoC